MYEEEVSAGCFTGVKFCGLVFVFDDFEELEAAAVEVEEAEDLLSFFEDFEDEVDVLGSDPDEVPVLVKNQYHPLEALSDPKLSELPKVLELDELEFLEVLDNELAVNVLPKDNVLPEDVDKLKSGFENENWMAIKNANIKKKM